MRCEGYAAKIMIVLINVFVSVCVLEIALRVQQKIGPLYDLDVGPAALLVGASDELNHVNLPGTEWDSNGIRRMDEPNSESCAPRLLFLGDSFMQGLGPSDTIPNHARRALSQLRGKDVCVFNAGASSYSPSIYVVQAKKLIPLLRPDLVVIDVDETDIYDEWYRYRDLVLRDATGLITAIRHTPLTSQFQQGLLESTNKLLYLNRLVAKLYFTRVEYPRLYEERMKNQVVPIFMSGLPESEIRISYADQVGYFIASLDDLTQTVLRLTGSPDKLVYIHHPHLQHLKPSPDRYNNIVSAALREVASRHQVRYYDATDDLKVEFGNVPENYYIPNDMHLNERGLRAYGIAVANYLAATTSPAQ